MLSKFKCCLKRKPKTTVNIEETIVNATNSEKIIIDIVNRKETVMDAIKPVVQMPTSLSLDEEIQKQKIVESKYKTIKFKSALLKFYIDLLLDIFYVSNYKIYFQHIDDTITKKIEKCNILYPQLIFCQNINLFDRINRLMLFDEFSIDEYYTTKFFKKYRNEHYAMYSSEYNEYMKKKINNFSNINTDPFECVYDSFPNSRSTTTIIKSKKTLEKEENLKKQNQIRLLEQYLSWCYNELDITISKMNIILFKNIKTEKQIEKSFEEKIEECGVNEKLFTTIEKMCNKNVIDYHNFNKYNKLCKSICLSPINLCKINIYDPTELNKSINLILGYALQSHKPKFDDQQNKYKFVRIYLDNKTIKNEINKIDKNIELYNNIFTNVINNNYDDKFTKNELNHFNKIKAYMKISKKNITDYLYRISSCNMYYKMIYIYRVYEIFCEIDNVLKKIKINKNMYYYFKYINLYIGQMTMYKNIMKSLISFINATHDYCVDKSPLYEKYKFKYILSE